MAPTTPNTGSADQLVVSLLPKGTAASKLRKYKDGFSRKLRIHNYARTNQFEVIERLDGLQEKFQIFNNDELADAIQFRLVKLKQHSEKWLPDILDLLLRLSDDPTNKARIEWLANTGTSSAVVPSLTWAEIEVDDPLDRKGQIWKFAEYSDFSSDDDAVAVVPTTSYPHTKISIREEQEIYPQAKFESIDPDVGRKASERLRGYQFWQNVSKESFELSELQVIREVLFMLQGLPTALFWKVGAQFEIDKRFRLMNTSRESFVDVLSEFGQIAIRLDLLRNFINKAQSECFMQTLRSSFEETLRHIDSKLFTLEQNILTKERQAAATILQLVANVSDIVEVTASLADFVATIESNKVDVVPCLELLFEGVCKVQGTGDEPGFQCLSRLFIRCFETYLRPLRDWMDQGTLYKDHGTIFITASGLSQDPSGLWQKWYRLADDSATDRCPGFLRCVKAQIFAIGKTVVFLRHLNASYERFDGPSMLIPQDSTFTHASSLLPFAELLATTVQDFVESRLRTVTSTLRDHLGSRCGLWKTLDALNCIYFGRNGYMADLIDLKIFAAIDRCDKNWNDRFLLGDLLQTVFEPIESVEVRRLALKSSPHASRNMSHRRQSVKLLQDLQIQYTLHWSVANVVTIPSLASYSRVSTFLTQIRRARYMLERRSLFQVQGGTPDCTPREKKLNQLLHHRLLLFINILYSHLTTLVIEESSSKLRQGLTNATDIDAMIAAHNQYCNNLEDACLTSKNLKPIHDEMISLLDLCIRFSDLNNPPKRGRSSSDADADAHSYVSATSHQRRRRRRLRNEEEEEEEDSSSEEEAESDDDAGEGYSTFMVPDNSTMMDRLEKVRGEFEKHLSFVVAGLSSIARAREQGSHWEILGSRLDWKGSTL